MVSHLTNNNNKNRIASQRIELYAVRILLRCISNFLHYTDFRILQLIFVLEETSTAQSLQFLPQRAFQFQKLCLF